MALTWRSAVGATGIEAQGPSTTMVAHTDGRYKWTFTAAAQQKNCTPGKQIGVIGTFANAVDNVAHIGLIGSLEVSAFPASGTAVQLLTNSDSNTGSSVNPKLLIMRDDGDLELYSGDGTLLDSAATPMSAATEYDVMAAWDYEDAADTYQFRFWIWNGSSWGTPVIDYTQTSVTPLVLTQTPWNIIMQAVDPTASSDPAITVYWKGAIFSHASDSDLPTYAMDTRFTPAGDLGTYSTNIDTHAGASTGPNVADVADAAEPDDDTTYDVCPFTADANRKQSFNMADISPALNGAEILMAVPSIWADPLTRNMRIIIIENATETASAGAVNATGYKGLAFMYTTTLPSTNAPTETNLNAMEIGQNRLIGLVVGCRLSTVRLGVWTKRPHSLVKQNRSSMRAGLVR